MCLILLALDVHPEYPLILAANRDEFHARPTAPLGRWPENQDVIAGRDLESGGTWLGVTTSGRWAAVTNFREPFAPATDAVSRGHLVARYLLGRDTPADYAAGLTDRFSDFRGFNLLVGTSDEAVWVSNRARANGTEHTRRLEPGIYGLSNHLLDTRWPKVERGKAELTALLSNGLPPDRRLLLDILLDRTRAADHELPGTGLPLELERAASAPFIVTPHYGTRSSTALLRSRAGDLLLSERVFAPDGAIVEERHFES